MLGVPTEGVRTMNESRAAGQAGVAVGGMSDDQIAAIGEAARKCSRGITPPHCVPCAALPWCTAHRYDPWTVAEAAEKALQASGRPTP